ncbi:MAG: DUF5659 domain-containing protein [Carnobacterium sp.]|uniref:DUF5659 domain-containing protein n=1 Tax=Carnobacterium sp. TaxID=48221 RepID=UPI003C7852E2
MTNKIKYYKCFSINMLRFIKIHGIRAVSKGVHANGKTYWVFEETEELSEVLYKWSEESKRRNK